LAIIQLAMACVLDDQFDIDSFSLAGPTIILEVVANSLSFAQIIQPAALNGSDVTKDIVAAQGRLV